MKNAGLQAALFVFIVALGVFVAYKMVHIPGQSEMVVLVVALLLAPIFRFPLLGVYAAFVLSPFVPFVRRLYYLLYGRPGVDPLIMMTDILVAVVFVGLFFEFRERFRDDRRNGFYLRLIFFYIVYLILRTFILNDCPMAEAVARLKFYAPSVLLFYIGYVFSHRYSHLKALWVITLGVGIIACLYSFKQLYLGYSEAEKIWFSSISFTTLFIKGIARPFSFFQSPACFADYLIIAIIAALFLASIGKARSRIVLVPVIPLLFYGILITSVRSNWIGGLAVFFFWFVFLNVKKASNRILVIVVVILVFLSFQVLEESVSSGLGLRAVAAATDTKSAAHEYVNLLVTARTGAITDPFQEHSLLSRIALWKMILSYSVIPQMAVFGRGLGALNADSLYFTYLAEFGYPGLIFIIFLTIGFISRGIGALDTLHDRRAFALVKAIVVFDMVFALMNVTGSHINSFPGDMYFWFLNGVLMNVSLLDKRISEGLGES